MNRDSTTTGCDVKRAFRLIATCLILCGCDQPRFETVPVQEVDNYTVNTNELSLLISAAEMGFALKEHGFYSTNVATIVRAVIQQGMTPEKAIYQVRRENEILNAAKPQDVK